MTDRTPRPPSGEFCFYCDRHITADQPADRVGAATMSMSGARPDQWAHDGCGPQARYWDASGHRTH